MTNIKYENILDAKADVIVIGVNTEGVAGKGLAKEFRLRWPEKAEEYRRACMVEYSVMSQRGYMFLDLGDGRHALMFASKERWREPSSKEQLKKVFQNLSEDFFALDMLEGKTVATPPLGAGLGRLDKNEVIPYVKKSFIKLGAFVDVYDLPRKDKRLIGQETTATTSQG